MAAMAPPNAAPSPPSSSRPLQNISIAMSTLAAATAAKGGEVPMREFVGLCDAIAHIFSYFGLVFKFAESDFVFKTNDLRSVADKPYHTLGPMVDDDVKKGSVKKKDSHARNLLRIRRGLHFVQLLLSQLLASTPQSSLKEMAGHAYEKSLAPYHPWSIRQGVKVGLYAAPTRASFMHSAKEDETSFREPVRLFLEQVQPLISHIDQLFVSRGFDLEW
eukprot:jgi/Chlat1/3292/Chrsp22S03542